MRNRQLKGKLRWFTLMDKQCPKNVGHFWKWEFQFTELNVNKYKFSSFLNIIQWFRSFYMILLQESEIIKNMLNSSFSNNIKRKKSCTWQGRRLIHWISLKDGKQFRLQKKLWLLSPDSSTFITLSKPTYICKSYLQQTFLLLHT